ncbi:MAG: hypothetical protein MK193_02890 [Lentisphaeria bacterium]|nr:hypothetical protein [Lentisphaeria bacterium]
MAAINHLQYLHGKKFCLVFMQGDDEKNIKLRTLHGRAMIDTKGLTVQHGGGAFAVPSSCYGNILESDGTDLLEDAEYYVICKVSGMDL